MKIAKSARGVVLTLVTVILLFAPIGKASIVIHDGRSGIVSYEGAGSGGYALDSLGRVWSAVGNGLWDRVPELDVPLPADSVRFWEVWSLITESNDQLSYQSGTWVTGGGWPGLSDIGDPIRMVMPTLRAVPNPTPSSCHVSFSVSRPGPVSVQLFDTSGRLVRELLRGEYPAGEYAPIWDGRDDSGQEMSAGVYLVKVATPAGDAVGRVVLAK